ncbi:hypothetical protein JTB14_028898 [Gonioctena quinquepunctata]|nr:hypothetical protein JTB14_028898 [Gonioctena quinquepunctata]
MKFFVLFLAVHGISSFPSAAIVSHQEVGIVNPTNANRGEIPYQGQLFISTSTGWKGCGASLLSANYALTTAYCTQDASYMYIILGMADKEKDTNQTIHIFEWVQHDNYNEAAGLNDIAIVKLETPAELDGYTAAVRLVDRANKDNTFEGVSARLSGWGQIEYFNGEYPPQILGKLDADVISNEECRHTFNFIDSTQMCTSGSKGGYCTGDQGGPLVIYSMQVGIISGGDVYCGEQLPTYHTRVGSHLDWIAANSDYVVW